MPRKASAIRDRAGRAQIAPDGQMKSTQETSSTRKGPERSHPRKKAEKHIAHALRSDAAKEAIALGGSERRLLPVTVLSGFLGAGKTTLLKRILRLAGGARQGGEAKEAKKIDRKSSTRALVAAEGPPQLKFAVIVNDMGEINLDASEIKNSKLIQEEAQMVELHNGCICCTLRGDLLKTVKALSEEQAFDYLVIESTGISEPLPVAQTFVMDIEAQAPQPLGDLLGDIFLNGEGAELSRAEALKDKHLALFFSASWCASCKSFTRELAKIYDGIKAKRDNLEIVFVSGDKDKKSFNVHFKQMPWLALPFDEERYEALSSHCNVEDIPTLVVLDQQGELMTVRPSDLVSLLKTFPDDVNESAVQSSKTNSTASTTTGFASSSGPSGDSRMELVATKLQSLSNFAKLDTLVTVVDALNIYDILGSLETLAEKNSARMAGRSTSEDEEVDDRNIAQLMLDQIEFANVIVLSKAHLHEKASAAVSEIKALLQRLNPSATVLVPSEPFFADLELGAVVGTGLFDMEKAEASAGWLQELEREAAGGHTPETEEYGISSVVLRRHDRPFHPKRLKALLKGFGNYKNSVAVGMGKSRRKNSKEVFEGVVRAKGQLWVASANAYPLDFNIAGRHLELVPSADPFLAAVPEEEWNEEDRNLHKDLVANGDWHAESFGDRESKAVFIGVSLDKGRIIQEVNRALLTDAELASGLEAWKEFEDVFYDGEYFELSSEEEESDNEDKSKDERVVVRARRAAASPADAGAARPARKRARSTLST